MLIRLKEAVAMNLDPGFPEVRLVTAGIVDEYTDSTSISITA